MRRLLRPVAALTLVAMTIPAFAAVSDEDIERARQAVNDLMAESEGLGREVQDAWALQFALEAEIADLQASIEFARIQVAEAEAKLEEVAVEMYMGSTSAASIQVLFSTSDEEYEAGLQYLEEISEDKVDVINQLRSFRAELDRQTERLAEASAEQEVVTAELQEKAAELQEDLVQAQAVFDTLVAQQQAEEEARRLEEERRRAEEEARRRAEAEATTTTTASASSTSAPSSSSTTAGDPGTTTTTSPPATTTTSGGEATTTTGAPPPPTGDGACPVAGAVSFADTWGAPRSGGRSHQGVDMIAARNTPLVAIRSGSIMRITTGTLSGLAVWLRADDGDEFFYAHLESYGEISVGQKVDEGYVIGYVGTSGNAPSWLPHLHFEWHPDGGAAVNPYPLVKAIC